MTALVQSTPWGKLPLPDRPETGRRRCQPFAVPATGTAIRIAPVAVLGGYPIGASVSIFTPAFDFDPPASVPAGGYETNVAKERQQHEHENRVSR